MADRVQAVKWESPSQGGTQEDMVPTELNVNEDGLDARAYFLQNDSSGDKNVAVSRDAGNNMTFQDGVVSGTKTLTELLAGAGGITEASHKVLRQLIHFINDGPAEGFASGAYKEVTGGIFPTSIVWYESAVKAKKIVERLITWTGTNATTDQWKIYDTDGSTVLATVTDTIVYSGIFEVNRTRTIA